MILSNIVVCRTWRPFLFVQLVVESLYSYFIASIMIRRRTPVGQPINWGLEIKEHVREFLEVLLISLAIILPIRYFLIQPFKVKGASMEPNFETSQYLIIDELSYRFHTPQRGEVIIFKHAGGALGIPREYFIKRLIGLPGEHVRIRDGKISITRPDDHESFILDESGYLPRDIYTSGDLDVTLESDQYIVLGDNRDASLDSRRIGPIFAHQITGRVWVRGLPFNQFTVFHPPIYSDQK